MKGRFLLAVALILVLSGGSFAIAHGNGTASSASHMIGSKQSDDMKGMDMNGKDKNMDMSGSNDNMAGMNMGGEEPVRETPPNVKVLGTYGAVNLSFILFGIWNKWFRRKDGSNGYSE